MFRHRLLTTLVLLPCVLAIIFFAPRWVFGGVLAVLVAVGGWEWLQLIPLRGWWSRIFFLLSLAIVATLGLWWFPQAIMTTLLFWLFILLAILTYPGSQKFWGYRSVVFCAGLLLLPWFIGALMALEQKQQGRSLIVYLLCLVWATDIGAYLVGKWCGRHKLIPLVSPGKTIEGSIGGFLLAFLIAAIAFLGLHPKNMLLWYILAIGIAFNAMIGDLLVSMLKRRCQIKDTGHLFPGHGGVLDRLDSLIAAAPLFYATLPYLGFN